MLFIGSQRASMGIGPRSHSRARAAFFIVVLVNFITPRHRHCTTRALAKLLRITEIASWMAGVLLCCAVVLAEADGVLGGHADLETFARQIGVPDQALWSANRIRSYRAVLGTPVGEPVAILNVPSLKLQVPVYHDTSESSLNRGAGLIEGMALPDRGGNLGIAGHRDGFFRVLKDIRKGDLIEVRTRVALHRYRVSSIEIVAQNDIRLLADTQLPEVRLVTCFPFYFLGSAPQRFIVSGAYEWVPPGTAGGV
jgi:LPXTG-site transpeptidase (sortase) family protein